MNIIVLEAANKDITDASQMALNASPKQLYLTFLLGLLREYFGMAMSKETTPEQIERGLFTLISYLPDKDARAIVQKHYNDLRDGSNPVDRKHAAILTGGLYTDYLAECMDLRESSEAAFL